MTSAILPLSLGKVRAGTHRWYLSLVQVILFHRSGVIRITIQSRIVVHLRTVREDLVLVLPLCTLASCGLLLS